MPGTKAPSKGTAVFHPLLFFIYPALFIYSHNVHEVPLPAVLKTLLFLLLAWALLYRLAARLVGDRFKAGLLLAWAAAWLFCYSSFFDYIDGVNVRASLWAWRVWRHKYIFPLWCLLFGLGAALIVRMKFQGRAVTRLLNVASSTLIVLCLVQIGINGFQGLAGGAPPEGVRPAPAIAAAAPVQGGAPDPLRPDIYYVILDAYAGRPALERYFGFDNRELHELLADRGFYVAQKSFSNYIETRLSLASSLNMDYLDCSGGRCAKWGEGSLYNSHRGVAIKDNLLKRTLQSRGYRFINVGFQNEYADVNFSRYSDEPFGGVMFHRRLSEYTPFKYLLTLKGFGKDSRHREQILYDFEALGNIPDLPGPKFVFAHVLCPHPPYVFDEHGGVLSFSQALRYGHRGMYLQQVKFINRKIKEAVDTILSKSQGRCIIILQGDHGASAGARQDYVFNPDYALEKFSILNAYYLPGENPPKLYPSISPVNSFRVVLNHYLGERYPILEDLSYVIVGDRAVKVTPAEPS